MLMLNIILNVIKQLLLIIYYVYIWKVTIWFSKINILTIYCDIVNINPSNILTRYFRILHTPSTNTILTFNMLFNTIMSLHKYSHTHTLCTYVRHQCSDQEEKWLINIHPHSKPHDIIIIFSTNWIIRV